VWRDRDDWQQDPSVSSSVTKIEHREGVAWYDARIPAPWHRCKPQTRGYVAGMWIERCACGSISVDVGPWEERNTRKPGDEE
jgi:hypothetical protein